MDIEAEIVPLLGALVGNRVHPNKLVQDGEFPAIQYQAEREPVATLMGPTGACKVTLTLTIVAETCTEARALATAVRRVLGRQPQLAIYPEAEPGDGYDAEVNLHLYVLVYTVWQFEP